MSSTLGKFIWGCSKVLAVIFVITILAGAASEGRLFQPITFLAAVIWGGGVLLVGGLISGRISGLLRSIGD